MKEKPAFLCAGKKCQHCGGSLDRAACSVMVTMLRTKDGREEVLQTLAKILQAPGFTPQRAIDETNKAFKPRKHK